MQTIKQLFELEGKVGIVTGGAYGIGRGIAMRLAEAGASIMISDIDLDGVNRTAEDIRAAGGIARAVFADAASVSDSNKVVRAAVDEYGRLDILVNNAGVYPYSPALDISEESWDKVLDTNLKGMFFCSQAAAKEMIKEGHGGKIINLASTRSFHPATGLTHYSASKAGVVMLTKSLALEFAAHNILVNAVAPGGIITPGSKEAGPEAARISSKSVEELTRSSATRKPLQRDREPDDIAKIVLFLVSPAADYITGDTILADAGFLLT